MRDHTAETHSRLPRGLLTHIALGAVGLLGIASCEGMKTQPKETWEDAGPQEVAPATEPTLPVSPDAEAPQLEAPDPVPQGVATPLPPTDIPARREGPQAGESEGSYEGWGTFRLGRGSFRYPEGWSVQSTAYGLVLTPPGSQNTDELIMVTANAAPGIREGTDPRVGQALDAMIGASMPAMRRRGGAQAVPSNIGSGGRFDYAGRAPDGRQAEGSVYVAVDGDKAAAISIVTDRRRLGKRRPVIEQIFQSFDSGSGDRAGTKRTAAEPGDLDPRLIGMFAGEAVHSSSGVYVNTRLVYALGGDGVLHYGAQSAINASQGDGAGGFRWTASGISGENVQRGTWTASNGHLTVEWDSGEVGTVAYGFEPDGTLALRDPFTRKLINIYSRVH